MTQDALPTPKQLIFAETLAERIGEKPSAATAGSRRRLAAWIGSKRHAQKAIDTPRTAPSVPSNVTRKQALERAVVALLACDASDREELMIAGLQRLWGDGPTETFLETQLQEDADWWALSSSPLALSVYLKAIMEALGDASAGRTTRKILQGLAFGPER